MAQVSAELIDLARDVVTVLILPACVWVVRTIQALREEMVTVRVLLVGPNGDNGLRGEMKDVRALRHVESNLLHTTVAKVEMLEHRTERLEARA